MSADPLIGRVVAGKMELLELLGSGAMGKVYRAHHRALDKTVAIKVLHSESGVSPAIALRFKSEARAASRLDHPNSLQILDFGEDGPDHLLYIAMEFLEGVTLQSLLAREGKLTPHRTAWIMGQVCSALAAAHDQGVIHRDVKPANVILTRKRGDHGIIQDHVKVCDFGLAKVLDTDPERSSNGPITQQGAVLGTPAYMSPEQAKGETVDHRSDVYSCGVILYRMLSGKKPFVGESAWAVSLKQIADSAQPIREIAPEISEELAAVVHRALEKDPTRRFQSARELKIALLESVGIEMDSQDSGIRTAAFSEPGTDLDPTFIPSPEAAEGTQPPKDGRSVEMPPARGSRARSLILGLGALAITVGTIAGITLAKITGPAETPIAAAPDASVEIEIQEPAKVTLEIVGAPAGTRVRSDGRVLGVLPGPIVLDRSDRPITFEFEADGYESLERAIVVDRDLHLSVALRKLEAPPPPPTRTRPAKAKQGDRHALENPFD
jgi:serine/threonine-protein kinase